MTIDARFIVERGDFCLDVDLSLPEKGISAIFGPSGCGKTTFLRAVAGLESVTSGTLSVFGQPWLNGRHCLPAYQRQIGYVFQQPSLFAHLTAKQNVEFGLKRISEADRKVSVDDAVDLLGISHLMDRRPDQLSGGEQQRVAIARALAVSPKLLLLDEPLAALDAARKAEILPYLESLNRHLDIPMLFVSHSRDEVARLANHLVLLDQGKVTAEGSVAELFSRMDLPLSSEQDAEVLIETNVQEHDEHFALTSLSFSGGTFSVPQLNRKLGESVRLQVMAKDVSLTLQSQSSTSILNIFPAVIDQIHDAGPAQVTVKLKVGNVFVLARITRKSAADLKLEQGKRVYAQIKGVAVLS